MSRVRPQVAPMLSSTCIRYGTALEVLGGSHRAGRRVAGRIAAGRDQR